MSDKPDDIKTVLAASPDEIRRLDMEINALARSTHERLQQLEGDPLAPPKPTPMPAPSPTPEIPEDARVIELKRGPNRVNIKRKWRAEGLVVVLGPPEAELVGLNHISTKSLIRFQGIKIKTIIEGSTPANMPGTNEIEFYDCAFNVKDGICWNFDKATAIGSIVSQSNVFGGNVPTYIAHNNAVDYYEDLIRGGFNSEYVNTTVLAHRGRKGDGRDDHGDVFEIQRRQGFRNLLIDGLFGPNGQSAEFGYTQGFAGGDISDFAVRNIKARFSGEGGIQMINAGGYWRSGLIENADISGAGVGFKRDFRSENVRVINSPAFRRFAA